jgi:hypothetical protein
VADDDHVGAHRVERLRGVDQRLALLHARLRGVHVDDIRAEPLSGDLERQQRAGAVLEERVDQGQTVEPLVGLGMGAVGIDPLLRLVEQERDLMRLEAVDPGEVPVREDGAALDQGGGAVIRSRHQERGVAPGRGGGKRMVERSSASTAGSECRTGQTVKPFGCSVKYPWDRIG